MKHKVMNEKEIKDFQNQLLRKDEYENLMNLFRMFADTTRLKIFYVLSLKECSVNDLSNILGMSQSAVSHQLSNLRKQNLVKFEKVGLNAFYSLVDDHVMTIFCQALAHIQE